MMTHEIVSRKRFSMAVLRDLECQPRGAPALPFRVEEVDYVRGGFGYLPCGIKGHTYCISVAQVAGVLSVLFVAATSGSLDVYPSSVTVCFQLDAEWMPYTVWSSIFTPFSFGKVSVHSESPL